MSLTHEVCTWILEQPGRRATLAQLREVFDPRRLAGALQQARRKRRLSYEDGAYYYDGSPTGHQQKVCRNDL
ncbi:MAG: hypothetical protein RLZZ217_904, partial [Planctomycetota bacterium]